ncbi:hypothetical protein A3J33_02800 [candidate division WWE3 bacterium RIFCSPLOWO2_02_FULL_53_10]|uniref:Uncharacterized protein n=2 Tax=Katanobacteria TaxID=422282 RepID=A0A1F4WC53_UNCKA|nr:MAG: hypothetical protein A2890_00890 [candidate division WWE3 bacterium RIFCSPLOWO2_01_FULL_53_14]OGC66969.1 MAG: hypothetical protein A3J33_02800 [candidate division WWE3 bacterium RIFCSPLOWO2_02_FULL_53_10]
MPSDSAPKIYVGDGSVLHSPGSLEPGSEFAILVCGESGLQRLQSALLANLKDGKDFLTMVVGRNVSRLADVSEKDVRALGFRDLYHLAESLRHRHPEITWNDQVTVVYFFVFEGYWE